MSGKKLTPKEIKELVRLLQKIKSPFPYPIFIALCKKIAMVAVDVAVMPDKNRVLLTYRKDDFYDGWHIPGSIMRHGEEPIDVFKRVCREELFLKINKPRFVGCFNNYDVRGHAFTLLYIMRPTKKPETGKYFKISEPPANLVSTHKKEIKYLNKIK